jgi:hypothetical protein
MIGDREIGDATGDPMCSNKLLLTSQSLHEWANNLVPGACIKASEIMVVAQTF